MSIFFTSVFSSIECRAGFGEVLFFTGSTVQRAGMALGYAGQGSPALQESSYFTVFSASCVYLPEAKNGLYTGGLLPTYIFIFLLVYIFTIKQRLRLLFLLKYDYHQTLKINVSISKDVMMIDYS